MTPHRGREVLTETDPSLTVHTSVSSEEQPVGLLPAHEIVHDGDRLGVHAAPRAAAAALLLVAGAGLSATGIVWF